MNRGIVFFLDGKPQAALLAVAIHSLRKNYTGPVCVVFGPHDTEVVEDNLPGDVEVRRLGSLKGGRGFASRCWNSKPTVHQMSPFDVSIVYDIDHVFVRSFDEKAFDMVEDNGLFSFYATAAHGPKKAHSIAAAIDRPDLIPLFQRTNGGCVGSVAGSEMVDQWDRWIRQIKSSGNRLLGKVPDEFALSATLADRGVQVSGEAWSVSARLSEPNPADPYMAYHFVRKSWIYRRLYRDALVEAYSEDFMGLKTEPWYRDCKSMIGIGCTS